MKLSQLVVLLVTAMIITLLPAMVAAKEKPIWAQDRTINAASDLCAYNQGVYRIRPIDGKQYRLICQDGTMMRVRITVTPNAVAVAAL